MLTTADFKKGLRILLEGDPYVILETQTHAPTARGGNTLIKVKVRNLRTNQILDRNFKSGERLEQPDVEKKTLQYLYLDGADLVFMDTESYEQIQVSKEILGEGAEWLSDGLLVKALFFEGKLLDLELPLWVEFKVTGVEPGTKGDTVSGTATKGATLSNGKAVQVPLFIKQGDLVRICPKDGKFVERAR
jgi:elongation factor P